jgi:hypothetical protein
MMKELISLDLEKIVSVEAYEDVAVESIDGLVAEQIKSVQSEKNPIADRSEVFWKALFNWYQYINSGTLSLERTTFLYVVITPGSFKPGSIPESFHSANTDKEAIVALRTARDTLWGTTEELKFQVPISYGSYLDVLFNNANSGIVTQIIKAMRIEIYSPDYDQRLFELFRSQSIPIEYADVLFTYMLGWVHERVNDETKHGKPAYIKCKDFINELRSQIRRYNQIGILAYVSTNPSDHDTQKELNRHDTYVKQLSFIELTISEKLRAASDFLRTSAEKTDWANSGIVVQQSFDEYRNGLIRMWNNHWGIESLDLLTPAVEKGRRLFYKCQIDVRISKVQGKDVPEFFGAGYLHYLANEPPNIPLIGWHPLYKDLLKSRGDESE